MSAKNPYGLSSEDYARLDSGWRNMISRCYDENNKSYRNYGGRGITICDEWKNDLHSFVSWAVSSGWKKGLTLDRIDVDGKYSPDNCRWETRKVQGRNTRRNIMITHNGETRCLSEWCEILGLSYTKVKQRHDNPKITTNEELFYPGDIREFRHHIIKVDKNGNIIQEYDRVRDAARDNNLDADTISTSIGRKKKYGGFYWMYKKNK